MLRQRIITAIFLAIVVISTIFLAPPFWVQGLFGLILLLATRELINLTLKDQKILSFLIPLVLVAAYFWGLSTLPESFILQQALWISLLWVAVLVSLPFYREQKAAGLPLRLLYLLIALLMIAGCVVSLLYLHSSHQQGAWILMYVLTVVWVADIGAYFAGRRFGRIKLAPNVSPGKTWEGVAGGLLANAIWMTAIYQITGGWGLSFTAFVGIGLATSAISVVGDLFESMLKRNAGVKDSGKLLPGHGGILDRIDGVIPAAPMFLAGVSLAGGW